MHYCLSELWSSVRIARVLKCGALSLFVLSKLIYIFVCLIFREGVSLCITLAVLELAL